MFPEEDMMLEVDGELIAEHDIDHGHEFAINRDGHIGYLQRTFGIVQLSFWNSIAEHAVLVLFILVGWCIDPFRWGTVLALWLGCAVWVLLRWWWRLACWHLSTAATAELYSIG